jgi:hypothetical protein
MTGRLSRIFFFILLVVSGVGFLIVPLGETSGLYEVVEDGTHTPTPPPEKITTFSPVAPIDISHLSNSPVQLTKGGCCSYAGWSADSEWILYLDGENDEISPGLYSIPRNGGFTRRLTERYGVFSQDWSHVAYPENGQVFVERWADGTRWVIPSNGRAISISPDLTNVAWEFGSQSIQSPDRRQSQIWIAKTNGEDARELITVHGGEFHGWVGGRDAILITGRLAPHTPAGIWRVDTSTGAALLLFEVEKPRSISLSPSGEWFAFIIAFEQDTRRNGIWVMKTDGSLTKRLLGFGAYRWRDDGQLLLIPLDLEAEHPGLYQIDIESRRIWRLIDPALVSLDIVNNDWSVSPDGNWLLYQSSEGRNLWIMELPKLPNTP